MGGQLLINENDLLLYGDTNSWRDKARALLQQQKGAWELLRKGYNSLNSVETHVLEFDGFVVKIQFNPGRLVSSSAKVDETSIKERPCFLCAQNLPPEQRGLAYGEGYLFLCNPFPILPEHFTIPNRNHTPQRIRWSFELLLQLSEDLGSEFVASYNGPGCGASAPDHLHFQAGTAHFMPVENEYFWLRAHKAEPLLENEGLRVYGVHDYLRHCILIEADKIESLKWVFSRVYDACQRAGGDAGEPMMNILAFHDHNGWRIVVFPRARHRPSFYYAEGDRKILLSPAAIDLGGVCTIPIESDVQKLTKDRLVQVYAEVSIASDTFRYATDLIRQISDDRS